MRDNNVTPETVTHLSPAYVTRRDVTGIARPHLVPPPISRVSDPPGGGQTWVVLDFPLWIFAKEEP